MTAASLFLGSWAKGKGIIDLPASEAWALEEDIRDGPASSIVEGLYAKTIISSSRVGIRCLGRRDKN